MGAQTVVGRAPIEARDKLTSMAKVTEMTTAGSYDKRLQMFVQEPRDANLATLRFLRWLAENGRFGRPVAGPPAGIYAEAPTKGDGGVAHGA